MRERLQHDRDRAVDAGAESARIGEQDVHHRLLRAPFDGSESRAAMPEAVENHQRGSHGDRRIGDVECRKRPSIIVEQQEVHHLAQHDPVAEVADRAAEDQREAGAVDRAAAALQQPRDQDDRGHRDRHEQPALPAARAGAEAERGAVVVREDEAEKAAERTHLVGLQPRLDAAFVAWSATTTTALSASQCNPRRNRAALPCSCVAARFAAPEKIRDAARRRSSDARDPRRHRRDSASSDRTCDAGWR